MVTLEQPPLFVKLTKLDIVDRSGRPFMVPLCAPQQCQAQHQLVDHTLHHAIGSHTNQLISRSATPDNITTCTMGAAQVPAYGTTTSTVAKDNHIDTTDQPVHSPTNLSKLDAPKRKADASREKSMAKSMCKLQLFDPTR